MNAVLDFWAHPVMDTIGLALLHFLWQAGLVGLAVLLALYVIPRANAPLRYNVCVGAMLLLLLLPLGTAVQIHVSHSPEAVMQVAQPNTELYQEQGQRAPEETIETEEAPATQDPIDAPIAEAAPKVAPSVQAQVSDNVFRSRHALALLWLVGLVFSSLRMLDGLITIWRLKRNAQTIDDPDLVQLFETVKGQLDITQPIAFKSTHQVLQPLLVGWLKPMVILPAGMLTGMAPAHIEAVLTHELIHVRRHDYLVLWLQSLLETLFFFHPIVWWISNQLRVEREYCTDAEAVVVMDDKLTYVQALAILEEQKVAWRMSLSAQDGRLVDRIRRLAGATEKRRRWQGSWIMLGTVLAGLVMLFMACEVAYVDDSKPAEELFQEANELAREGQYGRATAVAEVAAQKGDLCSIELLIDLYYPNKRSRTINPSLYLPEINWIGESDRKTAYWAKRYVSALEAEVEKGNAYAMRSLAMIYRSSYGTMWHRYVGADPGRVEALMLQAMDAGDAEAHFLYALLDVPRDSLVVRGEYFKKAALAGADQAYMFWASHSWQNGVRSYLDVARIAIDNNASGLNHWIGKNLKEMEKKASEGEPGSIEWLAIADSLELRERLAKIPEETLISSIYPAKPFCPGTVDWRYPLGLE